LKNYQNLDLGVRQNKKRVGDVRLPLWAREDPDLYLKINRAALESEYVSDHLHEWIDLIFGFKQRGQEAIKAFNLFHPFTYEGMIDIESIRDPIEKMGIKCQINEFGQCPKQIFKIPHPSRNSNQPIFADAFKV
jgi:factor associated with neutral sphingomyelinase activation